MTRSEPVSADPTPPNRPAYATRACYLAIFLTIGYELLSLIGWFTGPVATAPAITSVKAVAAAALLTMLICGVAAATRTLNGSNGWRITLIVFGWLTVVQCIFLIVLGSLAGKQFHSVDSSGNPVDGRFATHSWWIAWGVIWAIGAALCSIWLARKDVAAWTKPPIPRFVAAAGWYPWQDGRSHYWTGTQWADEIPPPPDGI